MRTLIPIAVLVVVVAVVAALAAAGVFGGSPRETVDAGPSVTEVIITFTPAEMAGGAQGGGAGAAVPPSTTAVTGVPAAATATSAPVIGTVTQGGSSPSTSSTTASSTTTASTAVAPAPTPPVTYVVRAGDTPASIAEALGVTTVDLMRVNGISDPTNLAVGAVLEVPGR